MWIISICMQIMCRKYAKNMQIKSILNELHICRTHPFHMHYMQIVCRNMLVICIYTLMISLNIAEICRKHTQKCAYINVHTCIFICKFNASICIIYVKCNTKCRCNLCYEMQLYALCSWPPEIAVAPAGPGVAAESQRQLQVQAGSGWGHCMGK